MWRPPRQHVAPLALGMVLTALVVACGAPPMARPSATVIPDAERPRHQHRHCHQEQLEGHTGRRTCHIHHHGPEHHHPDP